MNLPASDSREDLAKWLRDILDREGMFVGPPGDAARLVQADAVLALVQARVEEEREKCALLHDSIDPACSCEPRGTGAIGAIISYRDAIRARGGAK